MAEIRLDVDYAHPVERVWRALTDPRITEQWFIPGTLGTTVGGQYELRPRETDGLAGPIDVEVLEAVEAQRLVMQWTGERLHTEMTWALMPTAGGCRLSIVQSGFIGTPQSVRRLELRQAYTLLFVQALPPVLGRLATGEVDLGGERPLVLNTALPRPPRPEKPAGTPAGLLARYARVSRLPARWRTLGTGAAVVALLALAVVVLVLGLSSGDSRHQAQPFPQPIGGASLGPDVSIGGVRSGGHDPARPNAGASASAAVLDPALASGASGGAAGAAAGGGATPAPVVAGAGTGRFTASYAPLTGNGGEYQGQIRVGASGGTASGWTVVITLVGPAKVTSTSTNVSASQSGQTVTFTPVGNGTLAAGQSISFTFFYNHKKDSSPTPAGCAVNGDACSM